MDADFCQEAFLATVIARDVSQLPQAEFIQNFHNVLKSPTSATGAKIHLTWRLHLQPDNAASQAWFNPTLGNPDFQGRWFIGSRNLYSVNGYMFEIPASWADKYTQSRYLATDDLLYVLEQPTDGGKPVAALNAGVSLAQCRFQNLVAVLKYE